MSVQTNDIIKWYMIIIMFKLCNGVKVSPINKYGTQWYCDCDNKFVVRL